MTRNNILFLDTIWPYLFLIYKKVSKLLVVNNKNMLIEFKCTEKSSEQH